MGSSPKSFLLILIALALLPSAAQIGNAASNETRPKKHQEAANTESQTAKPLQPEPTVPQRNLDAAQAATLDALRALHTEQEARDKDNRANHEEHVANRISLGLLIVGVVYSFFAWKQWAAIRGQSTIANKSLKVAMQAFVSERPILAVVKMEQVRNEWARNFRPSIHVRNCGSKAAIIERCTTNTCKDDGNISIPVATPDYERGGEVPLQRTVIGPNEETVIAYGVRTLSEAEGLDLLTGQRKLAVFGKIWYRDPSGAPDDPYTCPFYWYYSPPGVVWDDGGFYRGPKRLNEEEHWD
jgi:hypothetical protein